MNPAIYKQPLVIFLGAGASVPLGMKTTAEFYRWLSNQKGIDWKLLDQISSHIEPSEEIGKAPDVEALLDFLETFIESARFLGKFGALDDAKRTIVEQREKSTGVKQFLTPPPEEEIVRDLDEVVTLHDHVKDLVVTHYSEIDENKAFELYQPLLKRFPPFTLPVFTTNYDLAIEKAFEHPEAQFRLIDGFEREKRTTPEWSGHSYRAYKPPEKGRDVILFKLHGSVDWHLTPAGSIQRVETKERNPGQMKTILVYPSRQKWEIHDEPFRRSYDYLFACLAHAQTCMIVGFSFRDQEIVEQLRAAIGINKDLVLWIVDPNVASIIEHLTKKLGFKPHVYPIEKEFCREVIERELPMLPKETLPKKAKEKI